MLIYGLVRTSLLTFADPLDFQSAPTVYSENLHVRLFTFMHALLIYYRLMLLPTGLHYKRGIEIHESPLDLPVWSSLLLLAALGLLLWRLWRSGSRAAPIWLFGAGWFLRRSGPSPASRRSTRGSTNTGSTSG